jgi:hypothetical protein
MTNSLTPNDELIQQQSIQQSLQEIAVQMGNAIDEGAAERIYQDASELLNHTAHAPITLARVAGTLLVYELQNTELSELEWIKSQIKQCSDDEEVEELIESLHRTDAL